MARIAQKDDFISQSELARRLDVSPNTIYKGVKSGRFKVIIKDGKKLFNYADCKRVFFETKNRSGTKKKINGKKSDVPGAELSDTLPPENGEKFGEGVVFDLHDARLKYEKYKSMKEQLSFEILQNKYITTESVQVLLIEIAQELKKSIMAIPDRIGPIIAGETDAHTVRQLMIEEFKRSLQTICDTNTLQKKLEGE